MSELLIVVGARPNFMKAASVAGAAQRAGISHALVHTGQHYDDELSRIFFDELGLTEPDVSLGVGSGSHAAQTARIMLAFEKVLLEIDPDIVIVVGDVNSTLACALVAVKERYPVAHVEAGLRCHDPWMPEEINRRLCDHVSSHLFTTSRDADENLSAEGIPNEKIHFVGNTMIDTFLRFRDLVGERDVAARYGLDARAYAVLTLHRPENVDQLETILPLVEAIAQVSNHVPVVFAVHPRTKKQLIALGIETIVASIPGLVVTEPLGYLDFVALTSAAKLVLTDSGGVQEETTVLGIPCLTLRDSTERPVTVTSGTNIVVGRDPGRIVSAAVAALEGERPSARAPELWDGRAGDRIIDLLRTAVVDLSGRSGRTSSNHESWVQAPERAGLQH